MQCNGEKLFICIASLSVCYCCGVVEWSGCKTGDGPIRSQSKDTIKYYNRNKCGVTPISGFLGIFC